MEAINLADRLRNLREAEGLSREKLSAASGLSLSVLRDLEVKEGQWNKVRDSTLIKLGKVLGVSIEYLKGEGVNSLGVQIEEMVMPAVKDQKKIADKILSMMANQSIDVSKPLTDHGDMPRPVHLKEDWDEESLCFLEGQRKAFISFLNLPSGEFGDLQDIMIQNASDFAFMHGIEVWDDKILNEKNDVILYPSKEKSWTSGYDIDLDSPIYLSSLGVVEDFCIVEIDSEEDDSNDKPLSVIRINDVLYAVSTDLIVLKGLKVRSK